MSDVRFKNQEREVVREATSPMKHAGDSEHSVEILLTKFTQETGWDKSLRGVHAAAGADKESGFVIVEPISFFLLEGFQGNLGRMVRPHCTNLGEVHGDEISGVLRLFRQNA